MKERKRHIALPSRNRQVAAIDTPTKRYHKHRRRCRVFRCTSFDVHCSHRSTVTMAQTVMFVPLIATIIIAIWHQLFEPNNGVHAYSVTTTKFDALIGPRCFNRSVTGKELVLGQNQPVGMSIENLISMIERFERRNPSLSPPQVIRMFLERFHMDGVKYNGKENQQSALEFKHAMLTRALLLDQSISSEFPENQFTEDEKCNLFFTISHVVNQTALHNENQANVYWSAPMIAKAPERNMGNEVVITTTAASTTPTTVKPVQGKFLESNDEKSVPSKSRKLNKRSLDRRINSETERVLRTKKPREYGVANFLSSKIGAVAVNRVLLGMLAGFLGNRDKKMSQVLKDLDGKKIMAGVKDEMVSSLFAVTLSDLYAIDTGKNMATGGGTMFGADGEWNSTTCYTQFVLASNEGIWGTLAEFRGGLDGYNIGRYLQTLIKDQPQITASQVLRFYYSKEGLSNIEGVCQRSKNILNDINDDLKNEATKYLVIWNALNYENQITYPRITGYIKEIDTTFMETMERAGKLNNDETAMCNKRYSNDLKTRPLESQVDALFVLDNSFKCSLDSECAQAQLVSKLTANLKLGRNAGSVSVFYNALGVNTPTMVDDEMFPVATPLYSIVYNSTSKQCAACKAANYDQSTQNTLYDRVEFLNQLNLTLGFFEEKRLNESGVPGKAVFLFDYGSLHPVPVERIKKLRYEQIHRHLLYVQRDCTFFGIGTNKSSLADIVTNEGNLISIDPHTPVLSDHVSTLVSEVPSIFQYGDCKSKPSYNHTYNGLITPGYKQYWAMYPDTFISSSKIELKFKAPNAPIQVCFGRVPKPESLQGNCKKTSKANEEISWTLPPPCKGFNFDKCPPMYFTVTVDSADSPVCADPACQNIEQTKWSFSHVGISCNGSSALSISFLLMAIIFILPFFSNQNSL